MAHFRYEIQGWRNDFESGGANSIGFIRVTDEHGILLISVGYSITF